MDVERDDREYELLVGGEVWPGQRDRGVWGPPENFSPGAPLECEIVRVTCEGKTWGPLTEEETQRAVDLLLQQFDEDDRDQCVDRLEEADFLDDFAEDDCDYE